MSINKFDARKKSYIVSKVPRMALMAVTTSSIVMYLDYNTILPKGPET